RDRLPTGTLLLLRKRCQRRRSGRRTRRLGRRQRRGGIGRLVRSRRIRLRRLLRRPPVLAQLHPPPHVLQLADDRVELFVEFLQTLDRTQGTADVLAHVLRQQSG